MSQSPNRRDRTRPAELLGLSAVLAGFVGVIAFMSTRSLTVGIIAFGVTFIVVLVTVATLALTVSSPSAVEQIDLDEQDRSQGH